MILPFVRELLADLENSVRLSAYAAILVEAPGEDVCPGSHLLPSTLPSVFCPGRQCPCLIVVADNKAAEACTRPSFPPVN